MTYRNIIALLLFAFFVGCAQDIGPGKVSGVVTLDGVPLADAVVSFIPDSGGVVAVGGTDASGKYELFYADGKKGAPAGLYKVCATTAAPQLERPESVPKKYLSTETTDITIEVKRGRNTANIDLKSQ